MRSSLFVFPGLASLLIVGVLGACSRSDDASEHVETPPSESRAAEETPSDVPGPSPAPVDSSPKTEPVAKAAETVITEEGLHRTPDGFALALRTGLTRDAANTIVRDALASGTMQLIKSERKQRQLRRSQLEVFTEELQPLRKSAIRTVQLTFFGDLLTGLLITYRSPDAKRTARYTEQYGPTTHGDGWLGWWLREQDLIVQSAPDGSVYEVFDLRAARSAVPEIDLVMLDSWRRRYRVPPPWGAALLENPGSSEPDLP